MLAVSGSHSTGLTSSEEESNQQKVGSVKNIFVCAYRDLIWRGIDLYICISVWGLYISESI